MPNWGQNKERKVQKIHPKIGQYQSSKKCVSNPNASDKSDAKARTRDEARLPLFVAFSTTEVVVSHEEFFEFECSAVV